MRRESKCKHYTGSINETCDAGVKYADVRKDNQPDPGYSLPCIAKYNHAGATCEKCQLPTAAEIAADEAAMRLWVEQVGQARAAIVAHLGGPWKKGTPGGSGQIDCPVCQQPSALRFSRSRYNGHIHARCNTPTCVNWME